MPAYVALLRAVNVGGTGKLPMSELKAMCSAAGFEKVRTYIASGNAVFLSDKSEPEVRAALAKRLKAYADQPIEVLVRKAGEMRDILKANPFPEAPANMTVVIFLNHPPSADALDGTRGLANEKISLGKREIYVAYGSGMGRSKLKIPAAAGGTARNINTVRKLADMAAAI